MCAACVCGRAPVSPAAGDHSSQSRDTSGTCGCELLDVVPVDTPDREPRHTQRVASGADEREPTGLRLRLRRRAVDRPDAEVVRVAAQVVPPLCRKADEELGSDEPPCLGERRVALPDVHAVRAAALDELRPVVEDEERAAPGAGAPERLCSPDELVVGELLVPELHDVDATAERCVEKDRRILAVRAR